MATVPAQGMRPLQCEENVLPSWFVIVSNTAEGEIQRPTGIAMPLKEKNSLSVRAVFPMGFRKAGDTGSKGTARVMCSSLSYSGRNWMDRVLTSLQG